jgi:hypothetical protein
MNGQGASRNSVSSGGWQASHHISMMAVMKIEAMIQGEPETDDRRRDGAKTFPKRPSLFYRAYLSPKTRQAGILAGGRSVCCSVGSS